MDKYQFDDSIIEAGRGKGTRRHTHLLNGQPLYGTSTVLGVLAKPLTWWASGLAVGHLGWTHHKIDGKAPRPVEDRLATLQPRFNEIKAMSTPEFLDCLDQAYKAHSVKLDTSAQAGIDMHSELESYVKLCISGNNGKPVIDQSEHKAVGFFSEWAVENVDRFIASEAYCYSKRLWTGGIVDLVYCDKNGEMGLLDFKSAKEAYDAHFMQNAGYDIAIRENGILDKDGKVAVHAERYAPFVRYSVLPFGMPELTVIHRENVADYKNGFEACVTLHKLIGKAPF